MINSSLTRECFLMFTIKRRRSEGRNLISIFYVKLFRSFQPFTPLINLDLLQYKNKNSVYVCRCSSNMKSFFLLKHILLPCSYMLSLQHWIYLFLFFCHEVLACTMVTATSGLCNKTESLSPTDPRQKLMC